MASAPAVSDSARPTRLLSLRGGCLLLVCAMLMAGCSEDVTRRFSSGPAEIVRPAPRIAGAMAAERRGAQFVTRIDVGEAPTSWRIQGAKRMELVTDEARPGAPSMLLLDGDEPLQVFIPVPDGVYDFNRVDVELSIQRYANLHVDWLVQGFGRSRVSEPLLATLDPQVVTVRLPYRTTAAGPPDELQILIGGVGEVRLGGVELFKEPWTQRLPDPASDPDHVRIGGQSRTAWGLSSRAPLEFELGTVAANELRFDFAAPGTVRLPDRKPSLRLRLVEGESVVFEQTYGLPHDKKPEPYWRVGTVDLVPFAGRALTARFEVVGGGDHEAFCALGPPQLATRSLRAPTVLLITSDTHRADHVRASGLGVEVETPALDALAARGVFFESCFTATNVTNPSHVALMTGTHPRDTRIIDNSTLLVRAAPTLAEHFRANGFLTFACVSANHLEPRHSGLGQGFDRVSAPHEAQRDGGETIADLVAWLPEAEGLPLFVWLHVFDAHTPYSPPGQYDRMYYPEGRDPFDPELDGALHESLAPTWLPGLKDPEFPAAQYRGEVSYLDTLLGRLFELERFRDASILFTADHGESFGQHGVYWDHAGLYPDSVHVPLILAWPGAPQGTRIDAPVEQIHAGRTLLDLAGLARVEFPGRNLLWPLTEDGGDEEPTRYGLASHGFEASLNRGRWLLILHLKGHRYGPVESELYHPPHKTELYDLEQDPGCLVNLARERRELTVELRAELVEWLLDARDLGWSRRAIGDAEARDKLTALGYTADAAPVEGDYPWIEPDCDCRPCQRWR